MEVFDATKLPATCRDIISALQKTQQEIANEIIDGLANDDLVGSSAGFRVTAQGIGRVMYMLDADYIPRFLEHTLDEDKVFRLHRSPKS